MSTKPLTPLGLAFVFAVLLAGWASAANGLQGASSHRASAAVQPPHVSGRSSGTKSAPRTSLKRVHSATAGHVQRIGSAGQRTTAAEPRHLGKAAHSIKHSKSHGKKAKSHHGGDGQDENSNGHGHSHSDGHGHSHGGGHGHRHGND